VVVYVGVGVVLDEVEALLPAVGVLHRLAELVEAEVPRPVDDAPVPQIRAVVHLVELAHRSLLLLRLKTESSTLHHTSLAISLPRVPTLCVSKYYRKWVTVKVSCESVLLMRRR